MRSLALSVLLCAAASGVHAQARPAVVESVELLVPNRPALLDISGKTHLVYELHLTNLLPVEISIGRIQVRAAHPPHLALADYSGGELADRLGRPGLRRGHPDPQVVGPGLRAVAYIWTALP